MDTCLKLIVAVLISTALAACGGGGGGGGGNTSSASSSSQTPVSNDTSKTPASNTSTGNSSGSSSNASTPPTNTVDVTLTWVAPVTRVNGEALLFSDIAGYEIYYFKDGTNAQDDQIISIKSANTVSHTVSNLTSGVYYFAIATLDISGLYSDTSDYVELVID